MRAQIAYHKKYLHENADYAATMGHCALLGAAIIRAVGIVAVPFGAGVEMIMG